MYDRFLNDSDYKGLITPAHLEQLTREDVECIKRAEESAEISILEYLSENYEIEKELEDGKSIKEYDRMITYPVGSYFYKDDKIWRAIRTINGYKQPSDILYWTEYIGDIDEEPDFYLQSKNYSPGDIVYFANAYYECVEYNGPGFGNIRIPGLIGWEKVDVYTWEANVPYNVWDVVGWEGGFYALVDDESIDLTIDPYQSDNWGRVGEYSPKYNEYEYSDHEYVVYNGAVYVPTMDVNSDEVKEGHNIMASDPRNSNVKKHILRMSVYELYKLISPNNVSQVRITDYEATLQWLKDASKLRINPQIPRKLGEDNKPVTDWQVATFQKDYDPRKNPWQI